MRAFVAGATGYTGREVVRELRLHGVPAVAHVRPDSPRLAEWEARFQAHYAVTDPTPWELHALRETLERWQPTHVFALLGTTRRRMSSAPQDSYESVDYGLSAMLMKAVLLTGLLPRFVYLSSVGVSEKTRNPYLAVRWRMESELRASGLPYVIARPSFITGSDREDFRLGERVGAAVVDSVLSVAGLLGARKARDRYASMTGGELASALVRAALDEHYANSILEAGQLRQLAE